MIMVHGDQQSGWARAIREKHVRQMTAHEQRFGKLGELQTPGQKKALMNELSKKTIRKKTN